MAATNTSWSAAAASATMDAKKPAIDCAATTSWLARCPSIAATA